MLRPACRRWRSRGSVARLHPIAIEPVEHFRAGLEGRLRRLPHCNHLAAARIVSEAGAALRRHRSHATRHARRETEVAVICSNTSRR